MRARNAAAKNPFQYAPQNCDRNRPSGGLLMRCQIIALLFARLKQRAELL
jgi:hypothetical protein